METEIITERLRMRRARGADLDAMHALMGDFEVVRQTASWPWPPDREFTRSRCEPVDPARGMAGPVLADGEMIGIMGLIEGELGYMLARDHWGRGYATEMGRALIVHGWARYDWPDIRADVFQGNPASGRVLEKLGFMEGAPGVGDCAARGGRFPTRTFRLARPRA